MSARVGSALAGDDGGCKGVVWRECGGVVERVVVECCDKILKTEIEVHIVKHY